MILTNRLVMAARIGPMTERRKTGATASWVAHATATPQTCSQSAFSDAVQPTTSRFQQTI
jgi:malate synthase